MLKLYMCDLCIVARKMYHIKFRSSWQLHLMRVCTIVGDGTVWSSRNEISFCDFVVCECVSECGRRFEFEFICKLSGCSLLEDVFIDDSSFRYNRAKY